MNAEAGLRYHKLISLVFLAALALVSLAFCPQALARYPRSVSDSQGTWVATDEALIQIVDELWTFYGAAQGLPSDRVRAVAADNREVWAATPRGLGRMDRNSRRWETFGAPDPLPSANVYGVSVDDRYTWVATAGGAVRYDKLAKRWEQVKLPGDEQACFDVISVGRTVWFATDQGLARFDRSTQQWRRVGPAEGLDVGRVTELSQQGENIWLFAERGLARYDLRAEAVTTYGEAEGLPSPLITAFATVEGLIWIGTDRGLVVYNPSSDAISPFLYGKGMPGGRVVGIEAATPYIWVATDEGLGRFNTMTGVWDQKRAEDGLAPATLVGTAMAGGVLALLQQGGFQSYQTQRDEWRRFLVSDVWAGKAGAATEASAFKYNLELIASGEANFSSSGDGWSHTEQIVPDLRLGLGTILDGGRSLDASVRLDFGDATTSGIREYDAELRLKGTAEDSLRELVLSDELRLHDQEDAHDLIDDAWLEGLGITQGLGDRSGRTRDPVELQIEAGLRRGARAREFFRGSIDHSYPLAHAYVTPRSEVVKVDGMILDRDLDYIITHTTGMLTFLNPDRVNALSLIAITYTYEQIPRKSTASSSILEMLPWDDELGSFKRSGSTTYVTDESGLYAQINGAAPKYLDRGWVESVFQDYAQGSTTLALQVHDMGTTEQALEIFDYDRPISYVVLWDEPDSTALLDESLPSGYAVKMRMERYYVELSIDEKNKSAEILVGLFAQSVRTKSDLAGTVQSELRPILGRVRVGLNPSDHMGIGTSYMGGQDLRDPVVMAAGGVIPNRMQLMALDAWSRHRLGSGSLGGELGSFFQVARSKLQPFDTEERSGHAASGNIIYSSEALNLRLDGEVHSQNFDAMGSRDTALGTFAGDLRADMTLNPVRWLSLRVLYDHERSTLAPELRADAEDRSAGVNENLLAKLSFMRRAWPTLWVLAGRSVLSGGGHSDEKLRFAGHFDYDLAKGFLSGLGMKKLAIKAYMDHSANDTQVLIVPEDEVDQLIGRRRWLFLGSSPGMAQNMRFELKFAPTATEDAYARFERKIFEPDKEVAEAALTAGTNPATFPLENWELIAGAASRVVPGLVPTFNGKMTYRDGADASGTGSEQANAILAGKLDLFPGRWIEALDSTLLSVGYGFTNSEEASYSLSDPESRFKEAHLIKDQVEIRAAYGRYDNFFRIESQAKWWKVREVLEGEDFHSDTEQYFEVLNRITFRPIYTSPITLRADVARLQQFNPLLEGGGLGRLLKLSPSLEWERRWSQNLVTKIRMETPFRLLSDAYDDLRETSLNYQEWALRPWAEIRLRLKDMAMGSLLRLAYRGYFQWTQPFDTGEAGTSGAEQAWELYSSLWLDWEKPGKFIIRLGLIHLYHACVDLDLPDAQANSECLSSHSIQPNLKAIIRF